MFELIFLSPSSVFFCERKFRYLEMKYFFLLFILLGLSSVVDAQSGTKSTNDQYVRIETNYGPMIFHLLKETPNHAKNFIKLAKRGYFNTYDFNRVIKGFVAQGGETDSAYAAMEREGKVLERIAPEFAPNLFHRKGALAAGRDDNKEKSSFLGQFYIVHGKKVTDNALEATEKKMGNGFKFSAEARKVYKEIGGTPFLDQNYTVFGQLVKGWEVLEKIMEQPTNKQDRPQNRISIKITVLSKKEISALNL